MARQILQQCLKCQSWTLSTECPACGRVAQAAAPINLSPEYHRAEISRKMYDVSSKEWAENLPIIDSLNEIRAKILATSEEE